MDFLGSHLNPIKKYGYPFTNLVAPNMGNGTNQPKFLQHPLHGELTPIGKHQPGKIEKLIWKSES